MHFCFMRRSELFLLWFSGLEWQQGPGQSKGAGTGDNGSRHRLLSRKISVPMSCAELAQVRQLMLIPGLVLKDACRLWGALWKLLWVGCRHCHLHVLREWHDLTYILGEKYFLPEYIFKIEKWKSNWITNLVPRHGCAIVWIIYHSLGDVCLTLMKSLLAN